MRIPVLILFVATAVYGQKNVALPAFVTLPPETIVPPGGKDAQSRHEAWGEVEFIKPVGVQRGEHWRANILYPAVSTGTPKPKGVDVFAKIGPALQSGGWTVIESRPQSNPFSALLHYQKDKEAWLSMQIFGASDIRLDLIIKGAQPMTFDMPKPAAVAPKVNPKAGDFPELPPLPGSRFESSASRPVMRLNIPSSSGKRESTIVANSAILKSYTKPDLSTVQFATVYRTALQTAGWTIVDSSQGLQQSDATVTAHYGNDGRNMWAYLHHAGGGYDIFVGEDTADDLSREFAKSCHVALYGVLFDFDKATLRPESDAVLTRAVSLIQSAQGAPIEVQGHTDAVGNDDYNQKLSEARAASVATWLTAHRIPASQLKSKGYGKTRPVADNSSDEGRAKNRRVEISRADCSK
jgi:outer membrane protein OmpA-like peptidoglycan-associated protein